VAEPAEHVCFPVFVDGVTAIVHGDPGMSEEARAALADLIRAAARLNTARETARTPEERARIEAVQARNWERLRRG
jgi:hypothetical protein